MREISELIRRMKLFQYKEIIVQCFVEKNYSKTTQNRRHIAGSLDFGGLITQVWKLRKFNLLSRIFGENFVKVTFLLIN